MAFFQRYLTGHLGPDSVLFLRVDVNPNNFEPNLQSVLFLPDPNEREEKWEGPRLRPGILGFISKIENSKSNFLFSRLDLFDCQSIDADNENESNERVVSLSATIKKDISNYEFKKSSKSKNVSFRMSNYFLNILMNNRSLNNY